MRISDWSSDVCSSDLKIAQTGNWPKQDHPYKNSPQNKLTQGTGRRAKAGPGRRPALGERAAPAASTGSEGRARPHILRPRQADRRLALPGFPLSASSKRPGIPVHHDFPLERQSVLQEKEVART